MAKNTIAVLAAKKKSKEEIRSKLTDVEVAIIAGMVEEGMSAREIAAELMR